jgi:hypothetical protein
MHNHQHQANKLSIFLSIACAIHCLMMPFVVVFLPFLSVYFEQYHWVEILIVFSTIILGTNSILHGYKYHHQNKIPAYLFVLGIGFLTTSSVLHFVYDMHNMPQQIINIIGALFSASAQIYNLKLCKN